MGCSLSGRGELDGEGICSGDIAVSDSIYLARPVSARTAGSVVVPRAQGNEKWKAERNIAVRIAQVVA